MPISSCLFRYSLNAFSTSSPNTVCILPYFFNTYSRNALTTSAFKPRTCSSALCISPPLCVCFCTATRGLLTAPEIRSR
uniref:Uncharacterized protein n=1 Tax=Uncultured archaeon GZfos26G2 TaxID=3386331 RepID=Q64CV6_UNCAG|nr:hypothetical protein GZ19C8_32 [uncultured archaeon GZfos19C8]